LAFRELKLEKDPNCPVCGKNPSIKELIDYEQFCGLKKNNDSEPICPPISENFHTKSTFLSLHSQINSIFIA